MADAATMIYTVDLGDHTVDVEGPANATPEQLHAAVTGAPANDQAPLITGGPQVEAGPQASRQLAPEDENALRHMLQNNASADEVRSFVSSKLPGAVINADELVKARDAGQGVNGGAINYPLPKVAEPGTAGGALARGAVRGMTFDLADEARAAIDGVKAKLAGGDYTDAYDKSVDQTRGQYAADEEQHGGANLIGQLLGGLVLPGGLEKVGLTAPIEAVGLAAGKAALREGLPMADARVIAQRAIVKRFATEGAAYGAAYGAGSAEGGPGQRLEGAGIGAVEGGLGGAALGVAGTKLAGSNVARASAPVIPTANEAFDQAAQRIGVDYLPADRPNALPSQWASALTNLTLGGIPLTEAAQKVVQSAKDGLDRISNLVGNFRTSDGGAADTVYAGQRLQRGASAFLDSTEKRAGDLYQAIPIADDRNAVLTNTRAALSDLTKGFGSNEALSKLWADNPRLKATLDALTPDTSPIVEGSPGATPVKQVGTAFENGQLSWSDLKRFRSIVGQIVGRPGLESDGAQIDAMRRLYGALSEDMRATASGTSDQALRAFERANSYFSARAKRISDTLSPIFGKDLNASPEDAYRALVGWSKRQGGDFGAVARTIRSLPEEDANTVRATILNSLGRVTKGRQDASGNVFSPSDFVSNWNDLSPRAKDVLFQGQSRKAIDDLVTVASGMKASGKFANTSKTGIAVGATGTAGALLANPLLGALSVAAQIGSGKLLGSPTVARWMTAYLKKPNPAAALQQIERLGNIAKAEPAIATDVLQLQQKLAQDFTPSRLAAQDQPNKEDQR